VIDTLAHQPDPYPVYARLRARGVHQLADGRWVIARASDVAEVLGCHAAVVGFQRAGPLAAIQGAMARFSDGVDHDRRRAIACDRLRALSPTVLRDQARGLTRQRLDGLREVEVMERIARHVPVAVLANASGIADIRTAVAATRTLCLALAPPMGSAADHDPDLTDTLRRLVAPASGEHSTDEHIANIVAVLFQAMDATAGLIGNAVTAAHRRSHDGGSETLVTGTNRYDPSVQLTTRVAAAPVRVGGHTIPAGDRMTVMLAAANHDHHDDHRGARSFTFGVGLRPCPGDVHALALATGVLEALTAAGARLAHDDIDYERRANLRIPARLTVRLG
jgi:cytochrome P450